MLTKVRYSTLDMVRWTMVEILLLLGYAGVITGLYVLAGLHFLRLPWAPVAVIGTAVAFIVGFQSNAAYGRIWEARKIWGGIVNASRAWAMRVKDCVTSEYANEAIPEDELEHHRQALVHRHLAWLTALRHAMRQSRPWENFDEASSNRRWSRDLHIPEREENLDELLGSLLGEAELERVCASTNRPAALVFEQSRHLRELKEQGLVWEFSFLEMQGSLETLLELQGKSERIKNFPYPRQYATIGYYFVRLFIFFIPFAALPEFASIAASLEVEWPGLGKHFVWTAVPFSALMSWIFHVMERIGRAGENPFQGSGNDVPISTMARGIEIDLREMMGDPKDQIPGQIPSPLNVQM